MFAIGGNFLVSFGGLEWNLERGGEWKGNPLRCKQREKREKEGCGRWEIMADNGTLQDGLRLCEGISGSGCAIDQRWE